VVFNLKLPMKQRHACVRDCLENIGTRLRQAGVDHELHCKQLYHDREEVTAFIALR
jgi:23S rRNA (cytidine2498-2'-O)-methyltransferase